MEEHKIIPVRKREDLIASAKEHNLRLEVIDEDITLVERVGNLPKLSGFKLDVMLIMLCKKGKMSVRLNESGFEMNRNDLIICTPSQIIGHYEVTPDFEGGVLCLSTKMLQEIFFYERDVWNKLFFVNDHPVIHIDDDEIAMFNEFYRFLQYKLAMKNKPRHAKVIRSLLQAVLYELMTYIEEKYVIPDKDTQMKQGDVLFKRFMQMLAGSDIKNRSLSYYADKLHVSSKYLSATCKEITGKTASVIIKESVAIDIKHLLLSSDLSVKEIVNVLDFPSLSFFGKFVRKHLGCSPTEYRRRSRTKNK